MSVVNRRLDLGSLVWWSVRSRSTRAGRQARGLRSSEKKGKSVNTILQSFLDAFLSPRVFILLNPGGLLVRRRQSRLSRRSSGRGAVVVARRQSEGFEVAHARIVVEKLSKLVLGKIEVIVRKSF